MKCTPGPWEAIKWECASETTVVARHADGVIVIAECSGHGRYASESVGDARLIAAAPELLEALEEVVNLVKGSYRLMNSALLGDKYGRPIVDKAEAAICKAKRIGVAQATPASVEV